MVSTTRIIGISRMTSIMESSPIRNRSASPWGILGDSNSQKRARTIAETRSSLGSILAGRKSRDKANPSAHFALAKKREGVPDGMNFVLDRERRRIQIPKQPVADGCLLLNDRFQFTHVNFRLRHGPQQAQAIKAIGRYLFGVQNF